MDNFGYSFQCERDWPLFDRVTEACRSIRQPSLVTSEDTDLSDDPERTLPSRHKRRGRINVRRFHQTPAKGPAGEWGATGGELGEPASRNRPVVPAWGIPFSPESQCPLYPSEDVWSGSEEDLELAIVNQFLMARGEATPKDDEPRDPQVVLISGTQVHPSKGQWPVVPTTESMRSTRMSISGCHRPCQCHAAGASVGPSVGPSAAMGMGGYIGGDLHSDYHLQGDKREVFGPGFKRTRDTQGSGDCEDTPQESREGTRDQSQPSEDGQHSAELVEGLHQSTLGEEVVTPTFVSDSNGGRFPISSEPTTGGGESTPEGLAEAGKCETDYSITVPEIYEYFYTDGGEQADRSTLSLLVPSEPAERGRRQRREMNFMKALKIFVSKHLPASRQAHSAVTPAGTSNTSALAKLNAYPDPSPSDGALVMYTPADGSQTMMEGFVREGRGGLCRSCIQNNLCLFCFACASWALKSATSNSDMWKAALLVNLSTIFTVRYFRRHVQREDSNIVALPDTQ
ncbi:PGC-1 and ERR-induced regulator in muscle protein 1 [Amblyraja radiata]|uniref:PGC-1 and ERR-induced regulator in muscle protein 1 n=1 Tax=Amblyraja radiata TaxID=386614 RepID=UPI00140358AE|nr:PGC-1 and ERR-induced regulator in muscle protein 1 [Amblyraja radiata]